jgi:hypothetical protein
MATTLSRQAACINRAPRSADTRVARRLAVLHAGGLLTAIYVPSLELEALRDLVARARTPGSIACGPGIGWAGSSCATIGGCRRPAGA